MKAIKYFLIICCCLLAVNGHAQGRMGKDQIEAMKAAYLTERLNLNTDDARVFWPLYDKYQDELDNIRNRRKDMRQDAKENFNSLTDKELESVVDNEIIFRQQEIDVLKKFHPQFKQALGLKRTILLYKSEEEFKKVLLNRLSNSRMR